MDRRQTLQSLLALAAAGTVPAARAAGEPERYATAWKRDGRDYAVLLGIDWQAARVTVHAEVALPGRAHGLEPLADGGVLVVGNRPGRWLWRLAADGAVVARAEWADQPTARTLNGHVIVGDDGTTALTTETDPTTGRGWITVRDLRTLAPLAAFESHGTDPHQLLAGDGGRLVVANGGLLRDAAGKKRDGEPVDSSLVLLDAASGRLEGRWTLPDRDLSLRHLAWSHDGQRLGIALQAEHTDAAQRAAAPLLAVLDGPRLVVPSRDARGQGYAGDITAAPGGGFVLSAQKAGRCLWWDPRSPAQLTLVAELTEPCALASSDHGLGVAIGAGFGAARWHADGAPRMLAWPAPLAPDNHWVRLARA